MAADPLGIGTEENIPKSSLNQIDDWLSGLGCVLEISFLCLGRGRP